MLLIVRFRKHIIPYNLICILPTRNYKFYQIANYLISFHRVLRIIAVINYMRLDLITKVAQLGAR